MRKPETYSIPEEIKHDVLAIKSRNNKLAEKVIHIMDEVRILMNQKNQYESERIVELDKLELLLKKYIKNLEGTVFRTHFDKMEVEVLDRIHPSQQ